MTAPGTGWSWSCPGTESRADISFDSRTWTASFLPRPIWCGRPLSKRRQRPGISAVKSTRTTCAWSGTGPGPITTGAVPATVVGYLVNSRHRVSTEVFRDPEFRFGHPKRYRVQAVSRDADPLILSGASDTLTIVPEDSFAPGAPRNVTAVDWDGEVRVYWDPNREADLAGYFVYRDRTGGTVRKISPLLQDRMFTDTTVREGETYRYRVSAVDKSDNESPPSPEASITIRN